MSTKTTVEVIGLRDSFAGMALVGLLANPEDGAAFDAHVIAGTCYELADAMLAARANEGKAP